MLIGQVCQRTIGIVVGSIHVMIRDEQVLITRDLRVRGKHWVSGDIRLLRISVKVATCFGFKVATLRSAATLVGLGWVSGFFPSRVS